MPSYITASQPCTLSLLHRVVIVRRMRACPCAAPRTRIRAQPHAYARGREQPHARLPLPLIVLVLAPLGVALSLRRAWREGARP